MYPLNSIVHGIQHNAEWIAISKEYDSPCAILLIDVLSNCFTQKLTETERVSPPVLKRQKTDEMACPIPDIVPITGLVNGKNSVYGG